MTDLAPFPDVEAGIIELLADLGTCDTETPSDLAGNLPFFRVAVVPGTDTRFFDAPKVVIDSFAVNRTDAKSAAEIVRQRMLSFPHALDAGVIDMVTTDQSPNEIPWANTGIRRFTATYTVSTRRSS